MTTTLDILIATLTARMERYAESPATVTDLHALAIELQTTQNAVTHNRRVLKRERNPMVGYVTVEEADRLRADVARLTAERDELLDAHEAARRDRDTFAANVRTVIVAEIAAWLDERSRAVYADGRARSKYDNGREIELRLAGEELRAGTWELK